MMRAVEGPLASVRGEPPEEIDYAGAAERAAARSGSRCARTCARVLEEVTLADVAAGKLPDGRGSAREEPGVLGHALTAADSTRERSAAAHTIWPSRQLELLGLGRA